jgi:hypothetical protein
MRHCPPCTRGSIRAVIPPRRQRTRNRTTLASQYRLLRLPTDHGVTPKMGWNVGRDRVQCIWRLRCRRRAKKLRDECLNGEKPVPWLHTRHAGCFHRYLAQGWHQLDDADRHTTLLARTNRARAHPDFSFFAQPSQQRATDAYFMAELMRLGSGLPYEQFADITPGVELSESAAGAGQIGIC